MACSAFSPASVKQNSLPRSWRTLSSPGNFVGEEIQTGRYGSETALPTDSELMLKYGLGRKTVRRAFQELVADGLVYRVRGRGTFPTTRPKSGGRTVRSTGSIEALEEWSGTEMEVISPLELRRDLENTRSDWNWMSPSWRG